MKLLFHIGEGEKIIHGSTLLCEWGNDYCCFSTYNLQTKTLQNLQYFSFNGLNNSVSDNILSEINKETEYDKILFCSSFSQAILTPDKMRHKHSPFLSYLYDEKNAVSLRDVIPEWKLINSYYFPANLYQRILTTFPLACFSHLYTPFIKIYNGYVAQDQVAVHFTPANFQVLVKKEGQLQLVQMYRYQAPLDVVYYLLKIVQEIGLSMEATFIILSGLIEENSALYKELHQYFLNIHFALPGQVSLQNNELPQHFFTSMYNLAACG